jgi:hypothetical protein
MDISVGVKNQAKSHPNYTKNLLISFQQVKINELQNCIIGYFLGSLHVKFSILFVFHHKSHNFISFQRIAWLKAQHYGKICLDVQN